MFRAKESQLNHRLAEPLARVLEVLSESISESTADKTSRRITEAVIRIDSMFTGMETQNKKAAYELQAINKKVDAFSAATEMVEHANETNRLLSARFYDERVIQPMVRSLFPIVDFIHEAIKKISGLKTKQATLDYLSALDTQLEQFLLCYGIECFSHDAGADFDPKTMKPLKREATSSEILSGSVAESMQCGFRNQHQILRLESVSLYEYEAPAS